VPLETVIVVPLETIIVVISVHSNNLKLWQHHDQPGTA